MHCVCMLALQCAKVWVIISHAALGAFSAGERHQPERTRILSYTNFIDDSAPGCWSYCTISENFATS